MQELPTYAHILKQMELVTGFKAFDVMLLGNGPGEWVSRVLTAHQHN